MFTGIIESLGRVESVQNVGGDVRLRIGTDLDMSDVHLGDSIATNGICLTVIEWGENWYAADVSRESLNRTTLGHWKITNRISGIVPVKASVVMPDSMILSKLPMNALPSPKAKL